ncbi:type III PLP-dependent enzyme domain-containing protein [Lapidilactobacillus bayanensis]|uniref:pyridoxal-dependent decarboxylase n=1 Tax=Lapidilactobacillus bayanensis TaxID=2485998 RepID=UPI0013DE00A2|nr:pyridoxal-dependent decarboxylase [Lapidilactobacillus bayanensis]
METPYFVIDQNKLADNLQELQEALAATFAKSIIGYSFKTNSVPWILDFMKCAGCYAEVVSDDEYQLAQKCGYAPDKIIYNGPAKSEATFADALAQGAIINLETHRELRWLEKYAMTGTKVGLRIQIDVETFCPGETAMGELGGRFGFQLAELPEILQQLQRLGVKLAGLHVHTSSRTRSLKVYQVLARESVAIIQQYQLNLDYLDIGGGFFGGDRAIPSFFDYMTVIRQQLQQLVNFTDLTLIVEPGASLIATPVSYVTSVIDVKRTPRQIYVTTDGTRLHLDHLFVKTSYQYQIRGQSAEDVVPQQIIAGFTCIENDHLFILKNAPLLKENQQIIYEKVGSYTMCFNPLFIKYFPAVYVKNDEGMKLVRRRWTVEDYVRGAK